MKQKYMILKNKREDAFKRMNALLYILKNNFGEEVIYFASDMDKVRKELTKCLSELVNIRNKNFSEDYGTIEVIFLDKNIGSKEEDEKYVKIIRHCGWGVLNYSTEILESDIIILAECASIQDAYWFTYENINDFANYIEDVLSIIKKECNDIDDVDFTYAINKKINDIINKYWMNTVEFDYALLDYPIKDIAEDFILYFEAKYGLEDITKDRISSNIAKDCEFHIFENQGLTEEVIKQLREKGVEVK